ncbi:MAG TPA: hypothetical protein VHW02_06440 [Rhizomicrobium sp.]|nr:hypothetical protein [Rhizomicrobium sp.]
MRHSLRVARRLVIFAVRIADAFDLARAGRGRRKAKTFAIPQIFKSALPRALRVETKRAGAVMYRPMPKRAAASAARTVHGNRTPNWRREGVRPFSHERAASSPRGMRRLVSRTMRFGETLWRKPMQRTGHAY